MSASRSRRARRPAPATKQPAGELRKPRSVRFVTAAAFLLPGSGQMLNGNAIRGITMQFFMLFLGFVTWQIASPGTSVVGRLAGGLLVYVFSVIDANAIAKKRVAAWERLSAVGADQRTSVAEQRPSTPRSGTPHGKPRARRAPAVGMASGHGEAARSPAPEPGGSGDDGSGRTP